MTPFQTASSHRPFLDQVRWISALMVAISHALGLLNSAAHGNQVVEWIANTRGATVTLFFILSGYLVGGSVIRNFDHFDFGRYTIARFSRIYIVLIPALLLTFALDISVWTFDRHNPVYDSVWQGGVLWDRSIWGRFSIERLLGTLLSVEPLTDLTPVGSAGALWSLGYEWMFYFSFPAIYAIGYRLGGHLGAGLAVVVSIAAVFAFSRINAAYWMVWVLGAYAAEVERAGWLRNRLWSPWLKAAAAVALIGYVAMGGHLNHQIGLPLAGIFGLIFLSCGDSWETRLITPADKPLAAFSYSLYVIHLQIMTALTALLVALHVLPLDGFTHPLHVLGWAAVYLALSIIIAYGFGQAFESRTPDLARALRARFTRPAVPDQ